MVPGQQKFQTLYKVWMNRMKMVRGAEFEKLQNWKFCKCTE